MGPAPGLMWASIGSRFGAVLIDFGFMFATMFVASLIAGAFGVEEVADRSIYSTGASVTYLVWFLFLLAYFPTCWWAFQSTLGQRMLGLRIIRGRDGDSLGLGETTIRYLLFAICTALLAIPALIAAAIAADEPARRTWWDSASGSVVVKRY
jgi:uncharacterized RDD family membrane protein YckC